MNEHEIRGALQREYAISDAEKPIVATTEVATCFAVTVYNERTKTAAIAHVDSATSTPELCDVIERVGGREIPNLQFSIAGGEYKFPASREKGESLIDFFHALGVQPDTSNMYNGNHDFISIDSRNGELSLIKKYQVTNPEAVFGEDYDRKKTINALKHCQSNNA